MSRAKKVATAAGGLFAVAAVMAPAANADTYVVNSTADPGDGTCDVAGTGDGCTLREAIEAADNHANSPVGTPDVINFAPDVTGQIQLDANSGGFFTNGALAISDDSLSIVGPGADKLTIVGPAHDRIFKIWGFGTVAEDYDVTISGLTLTGGHAESYGVECGGDPGDGGAIISTNFFSECERGDAASLTLSKMNIVGNQAEGGGGGVAVEQMQDTSKAATASGEASLTVNQSTISGNDAGFDGGGIAMYPGSSALAVNDSTIAHNNANGGDGGGIEILSSFPVASKAADSDAGAVTLPREVDNSTITDNDASNAGGGIQTDRNLILGSNIVYGNTVTTKVKASTASDVSTDGATITAGYSMFGTTSGATLTENPAGTNKTGVDPLLGALQNNGGTTPTELPADTSPAIDQGIANSLTEEQRETARTIDRSPADAADGTDVGAVELAAEPPPPTPTPEPTPLPGPATQLCLGKQVILTKGTDADETLTGTGVDDGILGSGGVDTIEGLSGDDCLFGQVGNDLVEGGPGDDNANGDRDNDVVNGNDGDDSVRGQNGNDKVNGGAGDDKVTGGFGDDKITGGPGDDFIKGSGGDDVIDLGTGQDFVHSGGGADEIFAADGEKDKIICGTGKDVAHVDPIDDVNKDCNTVDSVK